MRTYNKNNMRSICFLIFLSSLFLQAAVSNGYLLINSEYSGTLVINNKLEYAISSNVSKQIGLIPGKHFLKFYANGYTLDTIIEIQPKTQTLLRIRIQNKNTAHAEAKNTSMQPDELSLQTQIGQFNIDFNLEDYEAGNDFVKSVKLKTEKPMKVLLEYRITRSPQSYLNTGLDMSKRIRFEMNDEDNLYTRQTNFLLGSRKNETLVVSVKDEIDIKFFSAVQDVSLDFKVYAAEPSNLRIISQKTETNIKVVAKDTLDFLRNFYKSTKITGLHPKYGIFKTVIFENPQSENTIVEAVKKKEQVSEGLISVRYFLPKHTAKFEQNLDYSQVVMPSTTHQTIGEVKFNQGNEFKIGLKRYDLKKVKTVYVYVIALETVKGF